MSCIPHYAAGRRNPRADQKTKMSVFDTSKIRRHNTQLAVAEATKAAEDDAVAHTVVGNVSKGECQMINRVLLHSTSMGASETAPSMGRSRWGE